MILRGTKKGICLVKKPKIENLAIGCPFKGTFSREKCKFKIVPGLGSYAYAVQIFGCPFPVPGSLAQKKGEESVIFY
jgi:hypothetical protein